MSGELTHPEQLEFNFDLTRPDRQSNAARWDVSRPMLCLVVNNPAGPKAQTHHSLDPNSPEITRLIHVMGDTLTW